MFKRVTVSEFEQAVLFRDGRFLRLLDPGVHWIRGNTVLVDLRRRDTEVLAAPVRSRDLVPFGVRMMVSYRVKDAAAALLRAYDYRAHLVNDAVAAAHRVVSPVAMADLSAEHNRMEREIQDRLSLEAVSYGLRVEDVSILEFRFPRALRKKLKKMEVSGLS